MSDWLQLMVAGVIVGMVVFAILRSGQRNPESTGSLSRQINKLFAEVRGIKTEIESKASSADVAELRVELKRVEKEGASAAALTGLEGRLLAMEERIRGQGETLQAKIDGIAAATHRTEQMMQRMDHILMQKALSE
ncbi:hypothetical protein ACFQ1E_08040 [Sphingomonas canadensis]|uniref:DNA recombination protein RmuC n=1 Tax=Sphingomonas canadensis TaxID=1219257 RepID=A0ABW3HA17_9SPHN|nr:hypothetical protein [Sphingomonas canadensis]MCW3835986.1 hypothetical protein [Sphingomonas canadensis]